MSGVGRVSIVRTLPDEYYCGVEGVIAPSNDYADIVFELFGMMMMMMIIAVPTYSQFRAFRCFLRQ